MNEEEPLSPEEIQEQSERAFIQSEGRIFQGEILHPFTADRQIAAEMMGLKYGYVPEEDLHIVEFEIPAKGKGKKPEKQKVAAGYRGFFNDVIIVLWLCSVKASEAFKAQRKVEDALKKSQTWAGRKALSINSEAFNEASAVFLGIMDDIKKSRSVPEAKDESREEEEAPGE